MLEMRQFLNASRQGGLGWSWVLRNQLTTIFELDNVHVRNRNIPARSTGSGVSAFTLVVAAAGMATCAAAQPANGGIGGLPAPTGRFGIGRVTLLCTDSSRLEPLAPNRDPRELMVDVWYPADPGNGARAVYLDVTAFEQALGVEGLQKQLGGAYDPVKTGVARTHAVLGAPFARSLGRSPVLIFSPGGGMVRELYAAQIEDLASHGCVVAAITHTYDGFVTVFPNGSHVVYADNRWPELVGN
jgi:hypothetical protein